MHEPPPPPIQVRDQTPRVGKSLNAVVILLAIIAGIVASAIVLIAIVAFLFLNKPTAYEQFKTDMQKAAEQVDEKLEKEVKEAKRRNDWKEQVLKRVDEMQKEGRPADEIDRYIDSNWNNPPPGKKSP